MYILGEDNCVPNSMFPGETTDTPTLQTTPHGVNATLSITTDLSTLHKIQDSYLHEDFCRKLMNPSFNTKGISSANGLWYIGDCLIIPHTGNICEELFHLAHDNSGHFGADKLYATLHDAYYWPNMRWDLEKSYIPSCNDCLHNKSSTSKPTGQLHPLLIPDEHGDSVVMDFIRPPPIDEGCDCILTMTDHLGSNIHLIPT